MNSMLQLMAGVYVSFETVSVFNILLVDMSRDEQSKVCGVRNCMRLKLNSTIACTGQFVRWSFFATTRGRHIFQTFMC